MKNLKFKLNIQLFATLALNDVSIDIAAKAIENYMQGDCEPGDRGVNSTLTTDKAANNGRIRIYKVGVLPVIPRTMGATFNGGRFSNDIIYANNDEFELDVLSVNDTAIVIPEIQAEMCESAELRARYAGQIGKTNVKIKNGVCMAAKVYHSFVKDASHKTAITYTVGTDNMKDKVDDALAELLKGDLDNGVDIFPEETDRIIFTPNASSYFKKTGTFVVGGSNFAQEMVARGVISPEAARDMLGSGYVGEYSNIPCNMIDNAKLAAADGFLGLLKGTLSNFVLAVVSSAYANYYGMNDRGVEIGVPEKGRGTILKPLYRFGANTFFTKGNAWITKYGAHDPFSVYGVGSDAIGAVATATASAFNNTHWAPKLIAPGSRAEIKASVTNQAATGASVAVTSNGANLAKGVVVWYAAATDATTVEEFLTGYAAASKKGAVAVSSGSATISGASISGHYNVLAFDEDGTMGAIAHATIA